MEMLQVEFADSSGSHWLVLCGLRPAKPLQLAQKSPLIVAINRLKWRDRRDLFRGACDDKTGRAAGRTTVG